MELTRDILESILTDYDTQFYTNKSYKFITLLLQVLKLRQQESELVLLANVVQQAGLEDLYNFLIKKASDCNVAVYNISKELKDVYETEDF